MYNGKVDVLCLESGTIDIYTSGTPPPGTTTTPGKSLRILGRVSWLLPLWTHVWSVNKESDDDVFQF